MQWYYIVIIVVVSLAAVLTGLYFLSKKLQKTANTQQEAINSAKQVASILIIDKKKMRIQDSKLPKVVQEQVPWYLKFRKMPMVKAKIGPQITTLMCDDRVFKDLPVKKMVKVELAGMYIVGIKGGKPANAKSDKADKKESFMDKVKRIGRKKA